jgi:hypothetical protein
MNVEIGPRNSFSENICFKFSVLVGSLQCSLSVYRLKLLKIALRKINKERVFFFT